MEAPFDGLLMAWHFTPLGTPASKQKKNGFVRTEIQRLCDADEPNKGETAAHGYLGPGDVAVHIREVLARP